MAQASRDLIDAMYAIAKAAQPITGRGIGYKLFTRGLIGSMSVNDMQKVYRLLKIAREEGTIPWSWIVDETRELERVSTWSNTAEYAEAVATSYRRDFWDQQPVRVEVWSEKGTIRGVLQPVLDHYAVGFRVMHGFSSATSVNDVAEGGDGRDLIVLYVGDLDPSGMYMSQCDLPQRLADYGGKHVHLDRVALLPDSSGPRSWDHGWSKLRCDRACLCPSNQAAFFCCFCVCCGHVGNAFALSKRSGISTVFAASILSMPVRHAAMGNWLFIA
jgi:hypothetical protein